MPADSIGLPPNLLNPPAVVATADAPPPLKLELTERAPLRQRPGYEEAQALRAADAFEDAGSSPAQFASRLGGAFAGGVVGGLAVDALARAAKKSKTTEGPSLRALGPNVRNPISDFSGFGLGTKTGAAHNALHALPGAVAYLAGRNRGEGVGGSAAMACATGVGIEIGQAFTPGHRVDVSDIARTCVYGAVAGEALWQVNQYAEGQYAATGQAAYKALATVSNPERVIFGVGVDSQRKPKLMLGIRGTF